MPVLFNEKTGIKEFGLKHKLVIIESLIFVIPFLAALYIFSNIQINLGLSHITIISLILLLVLASLFLIHQIFDKIVGMVSSIKMAADGGGGSMDVLQDTYELHAIAVSFNQLMEKFEKTTAELNRRAFELLTIKELTESVSKSLDIDEMLKLLLDKAMIVSQAQIGSIFVIEMEERRFRIAAYKGAETSTAKNAYIKAATSMARYVLSDKKPLVVQDIETDPRTQKPNYFEFTSPSFISMPILIKNKLMGVLNLSKKESQMVFDSNDEQTLSILIGEIGFALENAILHSSIKEHLKDLEKRSAELTNANRQLQHEISERKGAEKELQKYSQIVSAVKEQILFIDKNYICQAVNEAYLKDYNKSRHEVIGHSMSEIAGQQAFDVQVKNLIDRCLMGEEIQVQCWQDLPGAGKRYLDICYYPFFEEKDLANGVVITARDITKIKQLEDHMLYAQKMEAIGTIASGVAHNFNNLLMAIQGNVSLMLLGLDSGHSNFKMLKNIEQQIQSGSEITSQLLGYSRKGRYEVKPISLNELIIETSEVFGQAKKEIRFQLELANDLPGVNADRGQIEQVLLNLYINAADAMPFGGSLILKTKNLSHTEITNKPYRPMPGKYVFLQVIDTGTGIDEKIQKRLFEPFFTTKTMGKGTGLGLASSYGIIKGHGGYIDVESQKNQGTTFNIYLPASDLPIEKHVETPAILTMGRETILLVDDEGIILETIVEILKRMGYTVFTAKSGTEAVQLYSKNWDKINLVILDMIMPDMGGGEVFDAIINMNKDAKVLLSSGYSLDGQARAIMARGCSGFIQKPFNVKSLSQKIRTILDGNKN